jgi:hypothetical protein
MDDAYRKSAILLAAGLAFLVALFGSFSGQDFPRISGMPVAQLNIVDISHKVCNFSVTEGWNLISIPCLDGNVLTPLALSSVYSNQTNLTNGTNCSALFFSVHSYDAVDSLDKWKSYNPCLPDYVVQDLTYMQDYRGYFIKMRTGSRIAYAGQISIPNLIDVYEGWNLVAYDSNDTERSREVGSSMASINDSYSALYNYANGSWERYNASVHEFNYLVPYHGYWLKMLNNDVWVIDW